MTAEFKPGDRVREKRAGATGTISGVPEGRDYARVRWDIAPSLRDPVALSDIEPAPAPAAPASEPEMRDSVDDAAREIAQTLSGLPDPGGFEGRDAAKAIIARHLAERDARIAELEWQLQHAEGVELAGDAMVEVYQKRVAHLEDRLKACAAAAEPPEDEHGIWTGSIVEAVQATADRARAAEDREVDLRDQVSGLGAALAAEREACASIADAHAVRCREHVSGRKAEDGARWVVARETALNIASAIRSRTITAEGADTGSADNADA